MSKVLKKIFFLLLPFLIVFTSIFLTDPYNYFKNEFFIKKEEKGNFSTNDVLTSLLQFRNNPKKSVILGDSRAFLLAVDSIESYSGKKFFNFGYGAANLNEIISTFEYLEKNYQIRNVVICLNFELYNYVANRRNNRVEGVVNIIDNPLLYFTNINVVESTFYILKSKIFNKKSIIDSIPKMSKEAFWKDQLNKSIVSFYSNYIYPEHYKKKLIELKKICQSKDIKYSFVIMPLHIDLQNMISKFKLQGEYDEFLRDLKSLGTVYDFNFPNEITINKDNFNDPLHLKQINNGFIINKIFNGVNTDYCNQYGDQVLWN